MQRAARCTHDRTGAIITPVVATLALATAGRAAEAYTAQTPTCTWLVEGASPLEPLRDGDTGVV